MAFVSLYEYMKVNRNIKTKGGYKLLAYCVTKSKENPNARIVFCFTEELQHKANFRKGDYLDIKFEPTTKELIVEKVFEGGRKLSGNKNARILKLEFPFIPELRFPIIKGLTEPKDVHVKRDSVICKMIFDKEEK